MIDLMRTCSFNLERLFQALGDTTRLRILNLLGSQEICVCYLVEALDQPQAKISRHLAYLRNAGIIRARRQGRWMHYSIVTPLDDGAARILGLVLATLRREKPMRADRLRLKQTARCEGQSGAVASAPQPRPAPRKGN